MKRRVQAAATKVTLRLKKAGISGRLDQGSATSLTTRGVEWLYLFVIFLLMAGVINAISNASTPGINLEIIVPNSSVQNITETFIMLFGYIVGALGAFALYLSGRQTIRARSAEMFFVGGMAFISVAMILGYYIISAT